ncbi:hypothetical protein GCM10010532_098260 [Dactylosporangium siamense]|uniref:Uncharacterized protein n=2 Tax=Dactylosporangium siamense TaxID=685454 RepID=A0A919Q2W3_9ACTN|nr:hypothetical protein Dsi01nite_109210 [Dactylosporangium siamense]
MSNQAQPYPDNDETSSQQPARRPLYLVRPAADSDATDQQGTSGVARGTASTGADTTWFAPAPRNGEGPAQPAGTEYAGIEYAGTEYGSGMGRGDDSGKRDSTGQRLAQAGRRAGPPYFDGAPATPPAYPGPVPGGIATAGAATAVVQSASGQVMSAEQVHEADEPPGPPGPQLVGMPWPRHPYDLRPPSPDLVGTVPRRPDAELDFDERSAVAELRWAVVRRLTEITANHAEAAWKLRHNKPVSPTLVVLLFAVPFEYQGMLRLELRADVRTWHLSDRVADPAAVLQEMAMLVHRGWRQQGSRFDVRARLTNQADEGWTPPDWRRQPEFLGVALSTLDTSVYGPWKRLRGRMMSGDDVPSEVLVQLTDGGRIRVMRHGSKEYYRVDRQASTSLNPDGRPPFLPWESKLALNSIWPTDPAAYVWHFLAELTRTIYWGWPAWR